MGFDEQDLLRRAGSFESEALAEVYDRFSPGLYRYAMRLLGNADLAEECLSETFSRLLQALKSRHGPRDHLQSYLYRIAHNWITDRYRRGSLPEVSIEVAEPADLSPQPEKAMVMEQQRQRVRSALMQLTPDQRQVVTLRYIEEWEIEDVAAALGKPGGAVKSLQHRGLAALKKILRTKEEA